MQLTLVSVGKVEAALDAVATAWPSYFSARRPRGIYNRGETPMKSTYAAIGGGYQNSVQPTTPFAVIRGGSGNVVQPAGAYATFGVGDNEKTISTVDANGVGGDSGVESETGGAGKEKEKEAPASPRWSSGARRWNLGPPRWRKPPNP